MGKVKRLSELDNVNIWLLKRAFNRYMSGESDRILFEVLFEKMTGEQFTTETARRCFEIIDNTDLSKRDRDVLNFVLDMIEGSVNIDGLALDDNYLKIIKSYDSSLVDMAVYNYEMFIREASSS